MDSNFFKDNSTNLKKNIFNVNYNINFENIKIKNNNQNINSNKHNDSSPNINNNNKKYNFYNVLQTINKNNSKGHVSLSKKSQEIQKRRLINNSRASKYRGVSKNGNKWQVYMMINKKNKYFGTFDSEEIAAQIYDILSIKNRGLKAKTNYKYNAKQIEKIFKTIKY